MSYVHVSQLQQLIAEYGIANLRFRIPSYRLHQIGFGLGIVKYEEDPDMVLCEIDESRYRVAAGYKIQLNPIGDTEHKYPSVTFYQMDLVHLINNSQDSYQLWVMEDFPTVYRRLI